MHYSRKSSVIRRIAKRAGKLCAAVWTFSPRARRYVGLAIFAAFCVAGFTSTSILADGIGGGGNGGGGGGHQSVYGWGWRLYTVAGSGPNDGFRNGTPWTTVRNECQSSSTQVAVFVVNDINNTQMGYDYHSNWYSPFRFANYKGDSGPPWITMAAAQAGFNALSPATKAGYTFGSNVSWYCYGSLAQWTTSGTSSVSASVVSPGTRVTWTHRAINQGPSKTDKAIRSTVTRTRTGSAASSTAGGSSSAGVAKGGTVASASRVYTTTLADAGKTLCERLNWSPNAYNSSGNESSSYACVSVKYGGGVSQQLLFDPSSTVVDDGTKINMTFNATNTTGTTVPVVFDGYVWYDRNYNGVIDAGESKIFTKGGGGSLPGRPSTTTVTTYAETVDLAKGGRVCAYWNVTSTNPLVTNLDGGVVRCAYIGYTPKLQAWGNDIRVGSSLTQGQNLPSLMKAQVSTIRSGASTIYRGTWSEYGLFAPFDSRAAVPQTSIFNVGSAAWPADGSPLATANQSDWSSLTFGNKFSASANPITANCQFGCFASPDEMGLLPNVEKYLTQHGLAGASNVTMLASGAGTYTIKNDIINNSDVPNIIIADNITIQETVNRVDAWLIARNSINTCNKVVGPTDMKLGDCKKTLRINGPIIAKTLIARRIGDVQTDKKSIGEVVDLRGDAYIWAYKTTHGGTAYQTTGVRELPPRY